MEPMDCEEYSSDVPGINPNHSRRDYASEAMAADMDRWVVFDSLNCSLDVWLQHNRPSVLSRAEGIGWISVPSPNTGDQDCPTCDPTGLQDSWEQLKQSGRTLDISSITAIAKMHNVTCGKWMFFTSDNSGAKIDYLWEIVARATANGMLGVSSKVCPYDPQKPGEYVVCMHHEDFTDSEAVFNLETAIRSAGIKCQLNYKPDCYTYLGIYRNNEWGIRPTLHESAFDLMKGTSILKTH